MTTGWGADPAPSIAYQLTAAAAFMDADEVVTVLAGLNPGAGLRVLAAIGAQVRVTMRLTRTPRSRVTKVIADTLPPGAVRDLALAAADGRTIPPLRGYGYEASAVCLARLKVEMLLEAGFSATQIAVAARRAAVR
jgi:hypothetical protein